MGVSVSSSLQRAPLGVVVLLHVVLLAHNRANHLLVSSSVEAGALHELGIGQHMVVVSAAYLLGGEGVILLGWVLHHLLGVLVAHHLVVLVRLTHHHIRLG